MEKMLLDPGEVSRLLGIGKSRVYSLLASGDIPSIRVGRSVRVQLQALQQWISSRASTAARPSSADSAASASDKT